MKLLKYIKQDYVEQLYRSFDMDPPKLALNEHKFTPCEDVQDDIIHILTIMKHKIFGSNYTLESSKLSREREVELFVLWIKKNIWRSLWRAIRELWRYGKKFYHSLRERPYFTGEESARFIVNDILTSTASKLLSI